jgi:hypothetical protein
MKSNINRRKKSVKKSTKKSSKIIKRSNKRSSKRSYKKSYKKSCKKTLNKNRKRSIKKTMSKKLSQKGGWRGFKRCRKLPWNECGPKSGCHWIPDLKESCRDISYKEENRSWYDRPSYSYIKALRDALKEERVRRGGQPPPDEYESVHAWLEAEYVELENLALSQWIPKSALIPEGEKEKMGQWEGSNGFKYKMITYLDKFKEFLVKDILEDNHILDSIRKDHGLEQTFDELEKERLRKDGGGAVQEMNAANLAMSSTFHSSDEEDEEDEEDNARKAQQGPTGLVSGLGFPGIMTRWNDYVDDFDRIIKLNLLMNFDWVQGMMDEWLQKPDSIDAVINWWWNIGGFDQQGLDRKIYLPSIDKDFFKQELKNDIENGNIKATLKSGKEMNIIEILANIRYWSPMNAEKWRLEEYFGDEEEDPLAIQRVQLLIDNHKKLPTDQGYTLFEARQESKRFNDGQVGTNLHQRYEGRKIPRQRRPGASTRLRAIQEVEGYG